MKQSPGDAVPFVDFIPDEEDMVDGEQAQELNFDGLSFEKEESKPLPFDPENELQFGIDPEYFVDHISQQVADIESFCLENEQYIISLEEYSFNEVCAQLNNLSEAASRTQGTLLWKRLRSQFGFEKAVDSKERRTQIGYWAAKFNTDYHRLENRIKDAMARELVPDTSHLSPTGGAEIARGIDSDNEEVIKDEIEQRLSATRSLDPTMERSTESVRAVKELAKNGNRMPALFRTRANNPDPVYRELTFWASIKTGQKAGKDGVVEDEMTYAPVMSVYFEEPTSEFLRPQFDDWKNVLLKKLGGRITESNLQTMSEVEHGTDEE